MKIQWKKLLFFIAVPLVVGAISGFISMSGMEEFKALIKPPLSPPPILFPIVWSILFILMGIASYLVYTSEKSDKVSVALVFYAIQLIFNFFWSIIFFNGQAYLFAFIWLVVLWLLILITTILFYQISKPAGYLMVPYLIWVAFAGYLNFAIYLLN
ncbi:MAG: tryptophan-rich sensory protein [Ruminococcaceae bacterium]|nr:tryptophan-rich sensory protein [Oscillospiraceae bacterium]